MSCTIISYVINPYIYDENKMNISVMSLEKLGFVGWFKQDIIFL